jgi:hypothetical protein
MYEMDEGTMLAVTWRGTQREFDRLQEAVGEHCECLEGMLGLPPTRCAAHAMLRDQGVLDHLLYVYRMRRLFIRREMYAMPSRARRETARPLDG